MAKQQNLTPQQLAFRDWLILSPAVRKELNLPETQKEYAAKIGVNQDTLTDWKRLPDFRPSMILEAWNSHVIDKLPKALDALLDGAATTGPTGARDRATLMRMPLIEEGLRELINRAKPTDDLEDKLIEKARAKLTPEKYDRFLEALDILTDTRRELQEAEELPPGR